MTSHIIWRIGYGDCKVEVTYCVAKYRSGIVPCTTVVLSTITVIRRGIQLHSFVH